nr:hypothetical protein [Novosphingobium flavum]
MLLYDGGTIHEVRPVTSGEHTGAFFWIQSGVRDAARRHLLHELDKTISALREAAAPSGEIIRLTAHYHALIRMWAEV